MQNSKRKIDTKENQIVFWLNSKNYSLEAIYSTAYVFLDRAYVFLDGDPEKEVSVCLKGKEKLNSLQLEAMEGEFLNELLNCLLRFKITQNNQKIREYIVASALVSGFPRELMSQSPFAEAGEDSWEDDPLGIAVPWEEKNEKKAGKVKKKHKK